ncbi:MAG TPA: MBL fold metallo-hydrolase [Candidatus Rikenella faecigallinarum]|uniref:MBL fold metallo-hydrolase n=1 Tax=Candidatus Rikenella faecigallinarum TaxID=2838745 RepID=A0A9D1QD85_9BACT|nr:MBL fold metallo-hydrolase [Candidatus Rikenella faecigallinarum]
MSETELTFLGTGTSQGVPIIGCHCPVCDSTDPHDKRLRSSVLIEQNGVRLVIDSGPDFRYQMLREGIDRIDAILYTHGHMDHVGGMDDVRAFNYVMGRAIDLYCEPRVERTLRRIFDYAFAEQRYPGVPEVVLHPIASDELPFTVHGVEVMPIRGMHYKLPVLGYRVGNIAYLTDMNAIEERELEKIRGVEVLVINALRRDPHLSHFTLDQALDIIAKTRPKRAYLTHISHQMGLYEDLCRVLPEGVFPAYDGLKIKA